MRALLYALLLWAWAGTLGGCLSAPTSDDWLAVGFRSPEQTLRAFQTGLRAKLPDLEYRSLSSELKRRFREENDGATLSQLAYREFRAELFRRQPWLQLAAKAEVQERIDLGPGRVRLLCEVDTWFHDESFAIDFVREDFYELYVGDKRAADDEADWDDLVRVREGELEARLPLPEGLSPRTLGELRIGREWKIAGFPLQPSGP